MGISRRGIYEEQRKSKKQRIVVYDTISRKAKFPLCFLSATFFESWFNFYCQTILKYIAKVNEYIFNISMY